MYKRFQIIAIMPILAVTSLIAPAQVKESCDTIMSHDLKEITVKSPESIKIGAKTIYLPPGELKTSISTASLLVAGLQIPQLVTDPSTGRISLTDGGRLVIRINGRQSTEADLMSISAKDVTKVEYTPYPGVRYGDATGLLDITVASRETGYQVMAGLLQSPNRGWGNYTDAFRARIGRSEWGLDYHSNPMWDMDCHRDNSESIILANGTVIKREENGIDRPNRMATHRGTMQYTYTTGQSFTLNVQTRMTRRNDRLISCGNITTDFEKTAITSTETELNPLRGWLWEMDVYMQLKLRNGAKIYLNAVPSKENSHAERSYITPTAEITTTIDSRCSGLLTEIVAEKRIGFGTASIGGRTQLSRTTSTTRSGTYNGNGKVKEATNCVFIQWSHSSGRWRYETGLSGTYHRLSSPKPSDYFSIGPRLSVGYEISHDINAALIAESHSLSPSASDLNPTPQQIDKYQWSHGNVGLSPYQLYDIKTMLGWRMLGSDWTLSLENKYYHKPITCSKAYYNEVIVSSPCNAGHNNDFAIKVNLRIPLASGITLSADGGWHTTKSRGKGYAHSYSQPYVNTQLMYVNGKWWIMAKYNSTYNKLWGETLTSASTNLTNIGAGYTYKSATFMAGVVNPFGRVSIKSHDMSAIAGYDRTYYAESSHTLIWAGVSVSIRHGKNRAPLNKKLDNEHDYKPINTTNK